MNWNRRVSLLLGLIALAGIIAFGVLLFGAGSTKRAQAAGAASALATDEATSTSSKMPATPLPPSGYLPYRNQQYHFSVYYPPNLQVQSYSESGGAFTVALQDPTTNVGFEVYVTPYSDKQITDAQFKTDEPSGVNQPTHVMIDGVPATMFYGSNSIMGDTHEIWFIHGGFLYEVTTYKQLDSWLSPIMQTWQFTP